MRRTIATACVLALISIVASAQQSVPQTPAPQKTAVPKKKPAKVKSKTPAMAEPRQVPAQTMPPVPATLMNSTPVKPNVTMEGGLLTIDAPNSTLSDVLSGVRRATGATIEGASPNERVAVRLGPGNPREVIAALLYGTPYDYVILGSQDRQDAVTRILLTQSSNADASSLQSTQNASAPQPPAQESVDDNPPDRTDSEDTTEVPGTRVGTDQEAQPQPAQTPSQPKTPEQLFKELQQLQQQKPPQ
jgi:hypothetical protein